MQDDVSDVVNNTTLGPYSFRVFVDCGWTEKRMKQSKAAPQLIGRRPIQQVSHGKRKRPLLETIARTNKKSKASLHIGAGIPELEDTALDILDPAKTRIVGGRSLRARK